MLQTAFVTGANGGMGSLLIPQLLSQGWRVFAGVANKTDTLPNHPNLTVLKVDVTQAKEIIEARRYVESKTSDTGLQAIINLAGIIVQGPLELVPQTEMRRVFDINVFGPHLIVQEFLPLIRKGKGRIINVTALSALVAAPFYGPVAASKVALSFLTDALRTELAPWHIPVVNVLPSATQTPVFKTARRAFASNIPNIPADKLKLYDEAIRNFNQTQQTQRQDEPAAPVKAILKALDAKRPKAYYLVGRDAKSANLARFMPVSVRDKMLVKLVGISSKR